MLCVLTSGNGRPWLLSEVTKTVRDSFFEVVRKSFREVVRDSFSEAVRELFIEVVRDSFIEVVRESFIEAVRKSFIDVRESFIEVVRESFVEAVRDSFGACFGLSSANLLRSWEIRGILVSKIGLVSFGGWEDEMSEGDGVDCAVRLEFAIVLLAGLSGVAFAVLEEVREVTDDDDVGVDFAGGEGRVCAEDLTEGDLDARGDFARFVSTNDKLLEDVFLVSDFADDDLGRGERGEAETPLGIRTGSDFTFVTGKSGLVFTTSLLLVLSFSSFVLLVSDNAVHTFFGRTASSCLTLVLFCSSSASSFLTFSFTGFLSFHTWCSFGLSLISTGTSSTFTLISSFSSSSDSESWLLVESSFFCSGWYCLSRTCQAKLQTAETVLNWWTTFRGIK